MFSYVFSAIDKILCCSSEKKKNVEWTPVTCGIIYVEYAKVFCNVHLLKDTLFYFMLLLN